jgi:hypothetical protein
MINKLKSNNNFGLLIFFFLQLNGKEYLFQILNANYLQKKDKRLIFLLFTFYYLISQLVLIYFKIPLLLYLI